MKVRVHFTTNTGVETYSEYTSNHLLVLNESAKQNLLEQFWFEHGEQAVDGIELVNE